MFRLISLSRQALPAAAALACVLALWEFYVRYSGIGPGILPAPSRVAEVLWLQRNMLADHTVPTLTATLAGFGLSIGLALLLAMALDFLPVLRRGLMPVFILSQTLPLIAIAPLVVLWFGFGLLPKILLVAFVTFFPMLVATLQGLAATDRDLMALLKSMGASRWAIFRVARLPSALPTFFAGLRISITYAVVGAIFAEYAGAERGLGIVMLNAKNSFRADLVLAAVAVSATLTSLLFATVLLLGRRLMPWTKNRA